MCRDLCLIICNKPVDFDVVWQLLRDLLNPPPSELLLSPDEDLFVLTMLQTSWIETVRQHAAADKQKLDFIVTADRPLSSSRRSSTGYNHSPESSCSGYEESNGYQLGDGYTSCWECGIVYGLGPRQLFCTSCGAERFGAAYEKQPTVESCTAHGNIEPTVVDPWLVSGSCAARGCTPPRRGSPPRKQTTEADPFAPHLQHQLKKVTQRHYLCDQSCQCVHASTDVCGVTVSHHVMSLPSAVSLLPSLIVAVSHLSLTHTLTITYTCCYDEMKGVTDLEIYSHADSLILSHYMISVHQLTR